LKKECGILSGQTVVYPYPPTIGSKDDLKWVIFPAKICYRKYVGMGVGSKEKVKKMAIAIVASSQKNDFPKLFRDLEKSISS
jgi:hypothetical protein